MNKTEPQQHRFLVYSVHSTMKCTQYRCTVYRGQRLVCSLVWGCQAQAREASGWLTTIRVTTEREREREREWRPGTSVTRRHSEACRARVPESISRKIEISEEHHLSVWSELSCWENSPWIIDEWVSGSFKFGIQVSVSSWRRLR